MKFRIRYVVDTTIDAKDCWPSDADPDQRTLMDLRQLIHIDGGIYKVLHDWDLRQAGELTLSVVEPPAAAPDAAYAASPTPIPADILTTIEDLCTHVDRGSKSALFGRVHDVRAWVRAQRTRPESGS